MSVSTENRRLWENEQRAIREFKEQNSSLAPRSTQAQECACSEASLAVALSAIETIENVLAPRPVVVTMRPPTVTRKPPNAYEFPATVTLVQRCRFTIAPPVTAGTAAVAVAPTSKRGAGGGALANGSMSFYVTSNYSFTSEHAGSSSSGAVGDEKSSATATATASDDNWSLYVEYDNPNHDSGRDQSLVPPAIRERLVLFSAAAAPAFIRPAWQWLRTQLDVPRGCVLQPFFRALMLWFGAGVESLLNSGGAAHTASQSFRLTAMNWNLNGAKQNANDDGAWPYDRIAAALTWYDARCAGAAPNPPFDRDALSIVLDYLGDGLVRPRQLNEADIRMRDSFFNAVADVRGLETPRLEYQFGLTSRSGVPNPIDPSLPDVINCRALHRFQLFSAGAVSPEAEYERAAARERERESLASVGLQFDVSLSYHFPAAYVHRSTVAPVSACVSVDVTPLYPIRRLTATQHASVAALVSESTSGGGGGGGGVEVIGGHPRRRLLYLSRDSPDLKSEHRSWLTCRYALAFDPRAKVTDLLRALLAWCWPAPATALIPQNELFRLLSHEQFEDLEIQTRWKCECIVCVQRRKEQTAKYKREQKLAKEKAEIAKAKGATEPTIADYDY